MLWEHFSYLKKNFHLTIIKGKNKDVWSKLNVSFVKEIIFKVCNQNSHKNPVITPDTLYIVAEPAL